MVNLGNLKSAVAIGKFDGLHIGHKKIIEKTVEAAKENSLVPTAYVINISNELTTKSEKTEIFNKYGIYNIVFQKFTKEFRNFSPDDFFKKVLIEKLNAKYVVVGNDFCFGKDRQGTAYELSNMCKDIKIGITIVDKVASNGEIVGSTLIKQELENGNIARVNELLGRKYSVSGIAVHGKHLGTSMGFPTVNFVNSDKILPASGVYITRTLYNGITYKSITNVGKNPTVDKDNCMKTETYIFDFDKSVYNEELKVEFLERIRSEKKFSSLKELSNQIDDDKKFALKYFEKNL